LWKLLKSRIDYNLESQCNIIEKFEKLVLKELHFNSSQHDPDMVSIHESLSKIGKFPVHDLTTVWFILFLNFHTGARGTDHPPFSNFLFTNLFSILYFFIISSLFPYFNLFVSIFIQSYVNIKLHVSSLYRYYTNEKV
jgi:hypothetical protein